MGHFNRLQHPTEKVIISRFKLNIFKQKVLSFLAKVKIPVLLSEKLRTDYIDFFKVTSESYFVRDSGFGPWKIAICREELNTDLPGGR